MTDDHATPVSSQRDRVISRYSGLARTALAGDAIRDCDPDGFADGCFGAAAYSADDAPETALRASLGCGNPVAVADLRPGETVLDLGSGGGLDVLLSARRVGPDGTAYGLDGSPDMLALARASAEKAGVTNARFLHGHIEDIPLPAEHVDVVISNCVINLSADKAARPGRGVPGAAARRAAGRQRRHRQRGPGPRPASRGRAARRLRQRHPDRRPSTTSCSPRPDSPHLRSPRPATRAAACTRPSSRRSGHQPRRDNRGTRSRLPPQLSTAGC